MQEIRLGLIGCGGMGQYHARYLGDLASARYTAAADGDAEALGTQTNEHGVAGFADGRELIDSGLVDAVLIATPHYAHPPLARHAFGRGVHVLTEKPVAVTAAAAQRTDEDYERARAAHPRLRYACMFQNRGAPKWHRVKRLIESGRIGPLQRVDWTISTWYRTQDYFDSAGWRATWAGEGGGILLNQSPHQLDLLQWFVGVPRSVTAMVGLGKHHRIEVEDEVTAMMRFDGGATGTFVTSTGESPGIDRLTIVGDGATLIADEGDVLELIENETPTSVFTRDGRGMFARPATNRSTIEPGGEDRGARGVTENFIEAIRDPDVELIAPGVEGIRSLELGNAMLMSGLRGQTVEIPMDREAYETMLQELIAESKSGGKSQDPTV